jgi:hypothetical protein
MLYTEYRGSPHTQHMTITTSIPGIDAYNNQFYNGIDLSQRISTVAFRL